MTKPISTHVVNPEHHEPNEHEHKKGHKCTRTASTREHEPRTEHKHLEHHEHLNRQEEHRMKKKTSMNTPTRRRRARDEEGMKGYELRKIVFPQNGDNKDEELSKRK